MINTLQNLILGNYDKIKVIPEIEEKIEDIDLMIKYTNYGDEYLVVRSNGKYYEYGWWQARIGHPDYEALDKPWTDRYYIRKPKLYFKYDKKCELSNDIYWLFTEYIHDRILNRPLRKYSKERAQSDFDYYLWRMKEYTESGIIYHNDDDENEVIRYLEVNDIKTEDNLAKLEEIKFNSRIDGADGIAGKREIGCTVSGDTIDFIFYKGEPVHWRKTKRKYHHDRFGFSVFTLDMKQFK